MKLGISYCEKIKTKANTLQVSTLEWILKIKKKEEKKIDCISTKDQHDDSG